MKCKTAYMFNFTDFSGQVFKNIIGDAENGCGLNEQVYSTVTLCFHLLLKRQAYNKRASGCINETKSYFSRPESAGKITMKILHRCM